MRKTVIYYFTGTGNTERIADAYLNALKAEGIESNKVKISCGASVQAIRDAEYVGIAFPVHAFNAPKPVLDFVRALPHVKDLQRRETGQADGGGPRKKVFLAATSGEPLGLNDAAFSKIISLLKRKGYLTVSARRYVMPYNIIFRHKEETASLMLQTAKELIRLDADAILKEESQPPRKNLFYNAVSLFFKIEHPAMKQLGKRFTANGACVGCGKCLDCPMGNITMAGNKAVFGNGCVGCMRCACLCPKNAVDTGILNAWKVNGKYAFKPYRFTRGQKIPAISADGRHDDYCRRFYEKYFVEAAERIAKSAECSNVLDISDDLYYNKKEV